MSATRYQPNPSLLGSMEGNTQGDYVRYVDYLAACRDAVAMARKLMGAIELVCIQLGSSGDALDAKLKTNKGYQEAQRVIETYGEEGK